MSDTFVKIRIQSDADTRGFVEAQRKIAELEGKTAELAASLEKAGKASNSIGQGFGIGIGGQVLSSIQQIPAALEAAVMEGIRFNATLESSRLGIAAVIKQFDTTGRFANFKDALAASGDAIDLLKEKAKTSPATFEQLVGGFQGLSGAYASAGLKMKEQVDLTVLMSQALAGLGIRSDQLLQESRALVTGNITEDAAAAKILGITKAQVDGARESGKLFEFLSEKLGAFAEAGEVGAKSYTTAISNIEDSLTQLKGVATAELFDQIKDGLGGINSTLSGDHAEQWAAGIGAGLGQIVKIAGDVKSTINSDPLFKALFTAASVGLPQVLGGAKSALGFLAKPAADAKREEQLGKERLALNTGLHGAQGDKEQGAAVAALEKAIAERRRQASEASGDELVSLNNHVKVLESMLARRQQLLGTVKEEASVTKNWYGSEKDLGKRAKAAGENRDMNRKLGEDVDAAALADMGPRERASRLQRQAEEARAAFASDLSQGKGIDLASGSGFSAGDAQKTIAGMVDAEAAKSFADRLREIMALEKDLAAARKEAGTDDRTNAETLTSLNEELAIQKEITAGHEGAAKQLEIERNLRKELAKIAESELAPAEKERANILAIQTAELQKQKAAADQLAKDQEAQKKRNAADADLAVETAGPGKRAQRDAKLKQYLQQQRDKLTDAGFKGDDLESRLDAAGAAKKRELMRADGRFGGEARQSRRDSLVDLSRGARLANLGQPEEDSFQRAFHRGGAGEMMPEAGPRIGADAAKPGEGVKDAGNAVAGALKQIEVQVQAMGTQVTAAVAGVSGQFAGATAAITAAMNEMKGEISTLQSEVANLRGY